MFGVSLFGVPLFAESSVLSAYVPTEDFTFNTYGLQNPGQYGIHISDFDIVTPTRDFKTTPVPGGHGLLLQEDWFRENPIRLHGWISQTNREQLENKIHEFMRNIHGQGGTLIMKDGGTFKEIQTTMQTVEFLNPHYATTRKEFNVTFQGIKSFWRDNAYSSQSLFDETSLSIDGTMDNSGSITAEPIVIVIFSAASAITAISFTNTTTGEEVSITESLSTGDVVIFDSEQKIVTVNGTEVEFSGVLPELIVGLNSYTIDLTGTSATVDITAKHKNQYLTP